MSENHPVAHPLPDGVYNNFTYACNTCAGTVTVISSTRQPHTCAGTERDELREILADNNTVRATVDAILAAGYRKPQQVTTVDELMALPVGSVVRLVDRGYVYVRQYGDSAFNDDDWISPMHYVFDFDWLPATVLHVGGAE